MSFKKVLKSYQINLIAMGGMIGSTYFLGTGYILSQIGPFILCAFLWGAFLTHLTMRAQADLASLETPNHLSFVGAVATHVSPSLACGIGWSYWVCWIVYIPAECVAGGILMQAFTPGIPVYIWASVFGLLITLFNLRQIKFFGEIASVLTVTQIILIVSFCALAVLIYLGLIGNSETLVRSHETNWAQLLPKEMIFVFINMVIVLVNFQGAEMIGLSASESSNPKKDVPRALRAIAHRVFWLFAVPLALLLLIFPWKEAGLGQSVFASALESHGLVFFSKIFTLFVVIGAVSCANSGLYATSRSLHALSVLKMGPHFLKKLDQKGTPASATLATMAVFWGLLLLSYFFSQEMFYANLLALAGFSGTVTWIAICLAQVKFRRKLSKEDSKGMSRYPYLTHFAIASQVVCLCVVAWSPDLRSAFYFGVPALLIPIFLYKFRTIK